MISLKKKENHRYETQIVVFKLILHNYIVFCYTITKTIKINESKIE